MQGQLVRHQVTKDWGITIGMSTLHPTRVNIRWLTDHWYNTTEMTVTEEPLNDIQFVSSCGREMYSHKREERT